MTDLSTRRPPVGAEEFAERVLQSALGLVDLVSIHLGDRLGWYRALADAGEGGLEPADLAARTGTHERYAREWLEQQAVSGILAVVSEDSTGRRYVVPDAVREVLVDRDSLLFSAPVARMFAASLAQLPALVEAYRNGGGVSWAQLGDDARESQADINRPWFEQRLAPALAAVPDLHERLTRPGARILDVACGLGWSTLALARAYPQAALVGVDIDAPSIDRARGNARDAGLGERVDFRAGDASTLEESGFDVAFVFEAVHDLPHPQSVLAAIRDALSPDGILVVMDEAVADGFTPEGDELERLMYGYSLLVCLPDSLSTPDSVGTGTVMRRAVLERYAAEAGFSAVEVLPIEDFAAFRFYALRP
ncbi:class I SAM-dependent methyltransferase [Naasia sp. SYSU D00057]|uniref:class I SAM-dependent methyltransferase n=1 Tax=Naasia sp. SYSU D00057 TaxID=2817380 RepID=UPI001B313B7E|nr:class I SAM-dependent methyltransferase [Naasia sp. SYSU D00057]